MFDFFFSVFPLLFGLVFLLVFGIILYSFIRMLAQKRRNDASPRLSVPARIVAKRTSTAHHHHHTGNMPHHTTYSTTYYVTFEFESGDRAEFAVAGEEYGLLAEHDAGVLTFQGTRFLGFTRS